MDYILIPVQQEHLNEENKKNNDWSQFGAISYAYVDRIIDELFKMLRI